MADGLQQQQQLPPLVQGEPSDDDEDDNGRAYEAWERQYAADHSWEALQEDERGFLRPLVGCTDPCAALRCAFLGGAGAGAGAGEPAK